MVWRDSKEVTSPSTVTTMDSMTIRSLYHLDTFRRNLRSVQEHVCGNSNGSLLNCLVCILKDLFNELCKMMSVSPIVDPLAIEHLVESRVISLRGCLGTLNSSKGDKSPTGKGSSNGGGSGANSSGQAFYETFLESLHRATMSTPTSHCHDAGCQLHFLSTEFSLTKVCLSCRTTCNIQRICQYVHNIETPPEHFLFLPSFEYGIKSSLDSNEFCVKPNCFGNLKIFRTLLVPPSVLTFRFSSAFEFAKLPTKIMPCLIFEQHSISELYINSLVLLSKDLFPSRSNLTPTSPPTSPNGTSSTTSSAILFFHTRLKLFIFMDRHQIIPLGAHWDEVKSESILQDYRPSLVTYANVPPPSPDPKDLNWDNHVYMNWPLNNGGINGNSHNGLPPPMPNMNIPSNYNPRAFSPQSSSMSSSSSPDMPLVHHHHPQHRYNNVLQQGVTSVQIHDPISSDSGLSEEIKSNNSSTNSSGGPELHFNMPFYGGGGIGGIILNPPELCGGGSSIPSTGGGSINGSILSSSYRETTSVNPNLNSEGGRFATIKRKSSGSSGTAVSNCARIKSHHSFNSKSRTMTNSLSVPDLTAVATVKPPNAFPAEQPAMSSRKVSFNYKVTLLDDPENVQEEYIPHPIFQSVINKMLQMQSGQK